MQVDGGAAKIDPAIEAVNMPLPTKPKNDKKIIEKKYLNKNWKILFIIRTNLICTTNKNNMNKLPAANGSWPLPPPQTNATLFARFLH